MDIQARRRSIFDQLLQVEDEHLLKAVQSLLEFGLEKANQTAEKDFADDFTPYQKERIAKSLQEIEEGKSIPHEAVNRYRSL